jgi:hypothetical protein
MDYLTANESNRCHTDIEKCVVQTKTHNSPCICECTRQNTYLETLHFKELYISI